MNTGPVSKSTAVSRKRIIHGEPSWRLATGDVEAFVTETGGHLGPVNYDRKGPGFAPFEIAPWASEAMVPSLPAILRVLRGDFFCMPFGGNATAFRGEHHPAHGETANSRWTFRGLLKTRERKTLHLSLRTRIRTGRVDKYISLFDGHAAVYSRHVISGMAGPMSFGHHAILKFPDKMGSGRISTSPFRFGQVFTEPTELPENRGYSALLPGARFDSIGKVPTVFGTETDLGRYPDRRGYEDIVILVSDPDLPFAWTAVTFPEQGRVWFALKDPRILRQTLFWISNGGRHYPPWNGRHVNVMGLEEVTSYFHSGLAESVRPNPIAVAGYPTSVVLDPKKVFTINYITASAKIPRTFDRVAAIHPTADGNGVVLTSCSGRKATVNLDLGFLRET